MESQLIGAPMTVRRPTASPGVLDGIPHSPQSSFAAAGQYNAVIVFFALCLFCLGFLPTLVADYVPQDQWRAFRYALLPGDTSFRAAACMNTTLHFYIYTGRPLVWIGECLEHAWVARIGDFLALRPIVLAVGVVSVVALGAALARVMGTLTLGIVVAAVALFSPGYSFMYSQGLTGVPVMLAMLLAVLSFICLVRAMDVYAEKGRTMALGWGLGSFTLFVLACFFYPAFAFITLPLAVLHFGYDTRWPFRVRALRLVASVAVFATAAIAYFAISKGIMSVFESVTEIQRRDLGGYNFNLNLGPQIIAQHLTILAHYVTRAMPVMNFVGWSAWVKLTVLAGLVATFVAQRPNATILTRETLAQAVMFAVVAVGGALASLAPWFVSAFDYVSDRQTVPLQFLMVVALAKLIALLVKLSARGGLRAAGMPLAIIILMLLPATVQQGSLAVAEVLQSELEIAHMRTAVKGLATSGKLFELRQFHVVRPDPGPSYNGRATVSGEVNTPATAANPEHILQILTAVLREVLPADKLRDLAVADCQLDRACVEKAAQGKALVLSQSVSGENPLLLEPHYILDYRNLQR